MKHSHVVCVDTKAEDCLLSPQHSICIIYTFPCQNLAKLILTFRKIISSYSGVVKPALVLSLLHGNLELRGFCFNLAEKEKRKRDRGKIKFLYRNNDYVKYYVHLSFTSR